MGGMVTPRLPNQQMGGVVPPSQPISQPQPGLTEMNDQLRPSSLGPGITIAPLGPSGPGVGFPPGPGGTGAGGPSTGLERFPNAGQQRAGKRTAKTKNFYPNVTLGKLKFKTVSQRQHVQRSVQLENLLCSKQTTSKWPFQTEIYTIMMLISNQINAQEESIEKLSKPWLKTSVMSFFRYFFNKSKNC